MKLNIDSRDLELLIEKKREYIGKKYGIVGLIEAVLLALSAYTESYEGLLIPATVIKCVFVGIAVIQIIFFIRELIRPDYNQNDLLEDIKKLDIVSRTSSIVAIKNSIHPTEYLLYYDKGWGMYMFPNFATVTDNENNIVRKLSEQLDIDADDISIGMKAEGQEKKLSTEHNEEREYYYRVYSVKIDKFSYESENEFTAEGRKYRWMSVDDMLSDDMIKEHNGYVVGLVRDRT